MTSDRCPGPLPRPDWLDGLAASWDKLGTLAAIYCAAAAILVLLLPVPWRYIVLAAAVVALAGALRWLTVWTVIGETVVSPVGDWQIGLGSSGFWEIRHLPGAGGGSPAETFGPYWNYRSARREVVSGRPAATSARRRATRTMRTRTTSADSAVLPEGES